MLFSPFQPTPFFFGSRFLHCRELSVASTAPPISSSIGGTVLLFIRAQNTDVSRVAYSTTSSAEISTDGGIVSPRALAVLRLMTCLKRVGCSTGRSPGFAPRGILST
jgi:hypothetical protein